MKVLSLLILLVSCSHPSGKDGAFSESGESVTRPVGLSLDSLSLSSFNQREVEGRLHGVKRAQESASTLSWQLQLEILSGEISGDLPQKVMQSLQEEKTSPEELDPYHYRLLLSFLKEENFPKVFYFLPRLFISKSDLYKARAYNIQGLLHLKVGRLGNAQASFEAAHKLDPKNESVRLNLASLRFQNGLFEGSRSLLKGEFKHPLGSFLKALVNQAEKGVPLDLVRCQELIKAFPQSKVFLFNCGHAAYTFHKDTKQAQKWLEASLKIKGGNKEIDALTKRVLSKTK